MDIDIRSTDPILLVQPDSRSEGKLKIHKKNLSELLAPVDDIPLSVISITGPPSTGKSLLYGCILRYLAAAELDEHDWMDYGNPGKPLDELQWPQEGKAPKSPGIWGGPEPYILKIGEGSKRREIGVLVLYTQLPSKGNQWDSEEIDICKLMGLTMAVSSLTIFNVYKNLDEQCLSAVGTYIKYAIQGQGVPKSISPAKAKGKYSPAAPLQNANFLIRDWNFPSDFPFGANGGRNFVKLEKLKDKPAHSRSSRESRLLINNLFENVSGCLLPFPGNGVISSTFEGSIKEMDQKFSKNLELFISHAINIDQLALKKDERGQEVNGRKFMEMMEAFGNAINDGKPDTGNILKRFRLKLKTTLEEQREYVKVGLQAYGDFWKKYEKADRFLDEKTMKDIHKRARDNGMAAFHQAIYPGKEDDDDEENDDGSDISDEEDGTAKVDESVKKMLLDRMSKRFGEIAEENDKRRRAFMEQCKEDSIKQYRDILEASFPEGRRLPSEKVFRRVSKETMATASAEYLERIGANGDRDIMNEEQEGEMDELMDKLAEEETKFYSNLFEGGDIGDEEFAEATQNENTLGRNKVEAKIGKSSTLKKRSSSEYKSGSSFGGDDESSLEGSVKGKGRTKKIKEVFQEVEEGDDDDDDGADEVGTLGSRKSRKVLDEANENELPKRVTRSSFRKAQEEQKLLKDHGKVVGELRKTNFKRA